MSRGTEALARAGRAVTRRLGMRSRPTRVAQPAWDAWRAGDLPLARELAANLLATGHAVDEARHVLVLADSVLGNYDGAINTHRMIAPRYERLDELNEPILCAHIHRGDIAGAVTLAERRGLARRGAIGARLRLAVERPLGIDIDGVVDVPFTDDPLTPFMPGFAGHLNDRPTVLRLDTGGSFVHLSRELAAAHGIDTIASAREFAALGRHRVGYGLADLEIGTIRLRNVPVAVHEKGLPPAAAFDVPLGPIVGTNILERFLTTVDAPNRRLVLSRRGDNIARARHLARLGAAQHVAPFGLWSDHLMIARGRVDGISGVNLFVDSGLVALTPDQGQVAMLVPRRTLARWGVARPQTGRFAELPGTLAIGTASREGMTAYPVTDRVWRDFGDWGGIRVDALISWGYLRHFTWTIDFERREYLFA
ncbi:retropepsin-like aspartic protease [Embleya sp. NPDC050154]|uniref:retropepsin-like aspartic protease n=1 Tax=Embleya sp. NPDC050154 TaxID=3363988 RepID=UPI0037BAF98E